MNGDSAKKKILLLGDASNCHQALAGGLRRLGHDVTVGSSGSAFMDTHRDIDLRRPLSGRAGGLALWLKAAATLTPSRIAGYDIIAVNGPAFLDLKPHRSHAMLRRLLGANANVFTTLMASDSFYVDMCVDPAGPLRYSEWAVDGRPTPYRRGAEETLRGWQEPTMRALTRALYEDVRGVASVLYEYDLVARRHLTASKTGYIGIPIDTSAVVPAPVAERPGEICIFLGRHRRRQALKGTDILEAAARSVVERHKGRARLEIVEDVSYDEYLGRMAHADLVLDQMYSYTPATNALLAMAMGKNVVSGAEPEYYNFIGEDELRPVLNVRPDYDDAVRVIEDVVTHPEDMALRGRLSREFVVRHNDSETVARRALDLWNRLSVC